MVRPSDVTAPSPARTQPLKKVATLLRIPSAVSFSTALTSIASLPGSAFPLPLSLSLHFLDLPSFLRILGTGEAEPTPWDRLLKQFFKSLVGEEPQHSSKMAAPHSARSPGEESDLEYQICKFQICHTKRTKPKSPHLK
ncbi:hypothetical protein XELAEV_18036797mg [Xenopus laevis]|uniref:Uncharacterized protein n=1 Tax=Xenopus laevis TaxID=8355 RepID=A0A974H9I8_XENLA|nr:hypothetical protein XELAEV_18036797mg [Xenopus laevis]